MSQSDLADLLAQLAKIEGHPHADQWLKILHSLVGMLQGDLSRLDIKILASTLHDMEMGYRAFAPYQHHRKVVIFGSARLDSSSAEYQHALHFAQCITQEGFMVLTGGGENRAASVLAGLRAARTSVALAPWVAVHDAARPAVSGRLIEAVWRAAREARAVAGGAGPALPVGLTVRRAEGALPALAGATLPREGLYVMQTPQVTRRELLLAALERCPVPLEQVTDDLQALELAGVGAMLVPGESVNVKVTVPEDLDFLTRNWTPEWQ